VAAQAPRRLRAPCAGALRDKWNNQVEVVAMNARLLVPALAIAGAIVLPPAASARPHPVPVVVPPHQTMTFQRPTLWKHVNQPARPLQFAPLYYNPYSLSPWQTGFGMMGFGAPGMFGFGGPGTSLCQQSAGYGETLGDLGSGGANSWFAPATVATTPLIDAVPATQTSLLPSMSHQSLCAAPMNPMGGLSIGL
jgi:hypothetical protein